MIFQQEIDLFIRQHSLFSSDDVILVALSGGADSVALLRVLIDLGYTCEVAHCNFHLRGEESMRDESFVRDLCYTWNIPFHHTDFDTLAYADTHKISIEMAARELRYEYFERIRKERCASVIAVAHHRDDNVETILLNLIRGTGIQGLTGMKSKNGSIVRPLLCMGRENILSYLKGKGQDFVTDSTNASAEYKRNKIRLEVIPLLKSINPSIDKTIQRMACHLTEVYTIFSEAVEAAHHRISIEPSETEYSWSISSLLKEQTPSTLLHEWLAPYGFNSSQITDIITQINGTSGAFHETKEWILLRNRDLLQLYKKETEAEKKPFEITGKGIYTLSGKEHLFVEIINDPTTDDLVRSKDVACLDANKIHFPLHVRRIEKGDRFIPFGMKGSKLISDYLTDQKLTLIQKQRQWIIFSEEQPVWLIGQRTDARCAIEKETRCMIRISLQRVSNKIK